MDGSGAIHSDSRCARKCAARAPSTRCFALIVDRTRRVPASVAPDWHHATGASPVCGSGARCTDTDPTRITRHLGTPHLETTVCAIPELVTPLSGPRRYRLAIIPVAEQGQMIAACPAQEPPSAAGSQRLPRKSCRARIALRRSGGGGYASGGRQSAEWNRCNRGQCSPPSNLSDRRTAAAAPRPGTSGLRSGRSGADRKFGAQAAWDMQCATSLEVLVVAWRTMNPEDRDYAGSRRVIRWQA